MTLPLLQPDGSEAALVEAFLRAHPSWLAEPPGLSRWLTPPVRVHGEQLADHMAAMVHAERAHAAAMAERADNVLAAGRAAAGLAARGQGAVLALLRSSDPVDCVGHEMPGILGVDAVNLCLEALHPGARPLPQGTVTRLLEGREGRVREVATDARPLPQGTVTRLVEGRQVLFPRVAHDARLLHAEAAGLAGHDALALVPGEG